MGYNGSMAKIQIGNREFKTKKAAKDFYRNIRDTYSNGETICAEDQEQLLNMVYAHHQAQTKVGCGISHFTVETDCEFGNSRHFMIHRIDGSQTDVSFLTAIDGPNKRRDKYSALRHAVIDQIKEFRSSVFSSVDTVRCPLRNTEITLYTCHVDHISPFTFVNLVDQWMNESCISLDKIEITPSSDNQIIAVMTNENQIKCWQKFHRTHAQLRVLSALGNLSDAKIQDDI